VGGVNAQPVHGLVDRSGRLVEADPPLLGLQLRAGGEAGGTIAVPQIAALARLAHRLGILISRAVIAADGENDIDLWVRAQPDGNEVRLTIGGWSPRPALPTIAARDIDRETDFLRASADWLWEADEALKIVALSAAAEEAIGGPASRMIGQPITQLVKLVEDEDGNLPLLAALAAQGRLDCQEAELRNGNGRVRLSAVPIHDGAGRFVGFRGNAAWHRVAPITPDEPRIVADAFGERLDRALREPLARIIARADSISARSEGPLRRDYAEYAGDIGTAGRHLLALVDDLVDLQAIERPDFRVDADPVDLADVARRAAGLLAVRASDRSVRIDKPGEDESLPARGDFKRVLQILVNLIGNAVRYSPDGAMVWIRAEQVGDRAVVVIADQGKGIDAEDHERIFEKFERVDQNEPGGSGLGLYIARRLARAMGGEIGVDSAPGQGARFTFTLPVS
jgi:signal transduction histidine kinase